MNSGPWEVYEEFNPELEVDDPQLNICYENNSIVSIYPGDYSADGVINWCKWVCTQLNRLGIQLEPQQQDYWYWHRCGDGNESGT